MKFLSFFLIFIGASILFVLLTHILHYFNKSRTPLEWSTYLLTYIQHLLGTAFLVNLQLMGFILIIYIIWGAAYYPLSWAEQHLQAYWYHWVIGASFIYFAGWLWYTGRKRFYSQFRFRKIRETPEEFRRKAFSPSWGIKLESVLRERLGFLNPLMIIIGLVFLAITCFASLTAALNDSGKIAFETVVEPKGMNRIFDFYLWHFCDLIPQLDVAETLNWKVPLTYTDKGVGWLLLSFKALMAYIVIARFYTWNKWRKELKVKPTATPSPQK